MKNNHTKNCGKFVLLIKVKNLAPFLLLVDFPYSFQTRSSPECLTENLAIVLQNVQTTKLEITNAFSFSTDKILPLSDGPALISVNIYLRNIHKIDDVKMVRNGSVQ